MRTAHHSTLGVGRPAAPQPRVTGSPGVATTEEGCSRMTGGELSGSGGRWVGGGGGGGKCCWFWRWYVPVNRGERGKLSLMHAGKNVTEI